MQLLRDLDPFHMGRLIWVFILFFPFFWVMISILQTDICKLIFSF